MNVQIEKSCNEKLQHEFEKLYFQLLTSKVREAYKTTDVWPKGNQIFNASKFKQQQKKMIKALYKLSNFHLRAPYTIIHKLH